MTWSDYAMLLEKEYEQFTLLLSFHGSTIHLGWNIIKHPSNSWGVCVCVCVCAYMYRIASLSSKQEISKSV
jgi:hypothetical protein